MEYNQQEILNALGKSFSMYKKYGARSTAKLLPIHSYVADVMRSIWGDSYKIHCMGGGNKELTVIGKYYPKNIDIAITDQHNNPVFCVGLKFVTSNYKQNGNNYFESMMGETANIQAHNNLPYAHLIFLRHETPYYKKNESGISSKTEIIYKRNLDKYINLMFDNVQAHRPHVLGLMLIDVDEQQESVVTTNIDQYFDSSLVEILNTKLSLSNFFNEIRAYNTFLKSKQ